MSVRARRKGREAAFRLLFTADQRVEPFEAVLTAEAAAGEVAAAAWTFASELASGAWDRLAELDGHLAELAVGWTVARMPAADRAILRLATYEMLHRDDVPVGVSINEAVELAKRYGTDESPRFVNGILGALARQLGAETDTAESDGGSDDE